jgi:hypothetical protein
MTKKNKRTTATKDKKVKKAASATPTPTPTPETKETLPPLSGSQLSALIFLAIGASKVVEFSAALKEDTSDPSICLSYLHDEDTCQHPAFRSLIQAKYYSAMFLWSLVAILIMIVWNTERYFAKFMTCLCVSPLSTTILGVSLAKGALAQGKSLHLMVVSFVLLCTSVPNSKEKLPFIAGFENKSFFKSLQGICLLSLIASSLMDLVLVSSSSERQNALLEGVEFPSSSAAVLVNFWCLDKLTMALVYLFALVHFPEGVQRKFLSLVVFMKLWEAFYVLPMMDVPFQDVTSRRIAILGSAIFCGVAWIVPSTPVKQKAI